MHTFNCTFFNHTNAVCTKWIRLQQKKKKSISMKKKKSLNGFKWLRFNSAPLLLFSMCGSMNMLIVSIAVYTHTSPLACSSGVAAHLQLTDTKLCLFSVLPDAEHFPMASGNIGVLKPCMFEPETDSEEGE